MARWKSVEEKGVLVRVPVDAAAHLEVLELDFREGRINAEEYNKKKSEIEKGFADSKDADKKAIAAKSSAQAKDRETVLKSQADRKKAVKAAAVARSAEKAKRKGGK